MGPSLRRGRNNINLSHMHRSGFVFRWIIGLPWPAGQPTCSECICTVAAVARRVVPRAVPHRTSATATDGAHARLLSLARSVNAEGSRVNDEVAATQLSGNEKTFRRNTAFRAALLYASLFFCPANCASQVLRVACIKRIIGSDYEISDQRK